MEIKACVTCKYYQGNEEYLHYNPDYCMKNARTYTNLVTGKTHWSNRSECSNQREHGFILSRILGQCGQDGRFYQKFEGAKPTRS